jgi:phospholipid/cholesterol/gamma-HCH transport system ATP-binding protein
MVSHDVAETMQIADWVYVISEGKVVESGSPEQLRSQGGEWTQQFIKGLPDGPVPFHFPADDLANDLGACL